MDRVFAERSSEGPPGQAPADPARWAMLAVLCSSLLLVAMDATILNVALPSLIKEMQPDALEQLWIIDIYGLVLGGLLITAGAVGDRLGRKLLFTTGFTVFGAASVLAATAGTTDSVLQLIAGRILLAIGGAMVMPSTLSLIRTIFTDAHERTLAIGIWAAVAGAGAAIGPLVGGLLVNSFSWSAAFWVNVPVVLVTVVAAVLLLPEYRSPSHHDLDLVAAALSIAGVILTAWGIKHLAGGFRPVDLAALLAGIAALTWFARRQLQSADPLLDVRLFASRPFLAAALATLTAMMAIGAALYLISLWLQYVRGHDALAAGLRTLPAAIALLASSLLTPWLLRRTGVRTVLTAGLAALLCGFVLLAAAPQPLEYGAVAAALVTFGIGDGMAITASAAVMVSAVRPERAGQAGAVSESAYELGIGFGVALLGSIHTTLFRSGMTNLPGRVRGAARETARESVGGADHVARDLGYTTGAGRSLLAVARTAFNDALRTTSLVSVGIVATAVVLAAVLVPKDFRADSAH
ncbi:MFS transporter [Streptomyces roseifaciens]|uniref:MFS transporter n=1 Tax=Streptomyces roseifaciens TaxID=1488406 RepID=UPI001FE23C1F|nr:MFS transporter [Streptomyces roseifaciens]